MNRIPKNFKTKVFNPSRLKQIKKPNPIAETTVNKFKKFEKTPAKDYLDFSTEELGYFTRRDSKTNKVLEVFETFFPR